MLVENGVPSDKVLVKYTGIKKEFYNYDKDNIAKNIFSDDVLYYGDSAKERGFDIIFQLARKMPELKFKVLLRWEKENCRFELEEIKKLKNVIVWSYPYKEDLKQIILKSKLVVLPFRWMGMRPPISLVESMLSGKCVITSPMGGNEEIIDNGNNGIMINFNDLEGIVNKIHCLLRNTDQREEIGKKARETMKEKFSLSEYDRIFEYYQYIKSDYYEKRMFDNIGGKFISNKEANVLLKLLQPQDSDNILDVGTGSGRFARTIVKTSGARVTGLDPDEKILKEGEKLNNIYLSNEEKERYNCVFGDGHNIPFEDGKFDKVFCFRVLKYYKNPWQGINELIRILKPDGILVLEIISDQSWESLIRPFQKSGRKQYISFWEEHMRPFNPKEVKKYLLNKNVAIIEEKSLHKIPPLVYTKLKNKHTNYLLNALDKVLLITTSKYLFSKSIVLKCKKL